MFKSCVDCRIIPHSFSSHKEKFTLIRPFTMENGSWILRSCKKAASYCINSTWMWQELIRLGRRFLLVKFIGVLGFYCSVLWLLHCIRARPARVPLRKQPAKAIETRKCNTTFGEFISRSASLILTNALMCRYLLPPPTTAGTLLSRAHSSGKYNSLNCLPLNYIRKFSKWIPSNEEASAWPSSHIARVADKIMSEASFSLITFQPGREGRTFRKRHAARGAGHGVYYMLYRWGRGSMLTLRVIMYRPFMYTGPIHGQRGAPGPSRRTGRSWWR